MNTTTKKPKSARENLDMLWLLIITERFNEVFKNELEKITNQENVNRQTFEDFLEQYGLDEEAGRKYWLGSNFPSIYLTQREADCAIFLLYGKSVDEMAEELGLSIRTVEFYIDSLKIQLDVRSRENLVRLLGMSNILRAYRSPS